MKMKEYRALLKLQKPEKNNPLRLHRQEYEVTSCDYTFARDYDRKGNVLSSLTGGTINLSLYALPTDELMAWVFDHRKFLNGEITMFENTEGGNENRLTFEKARCVKFKMKYSVTGPIHLFMQLTINTPIMILGNTEIINVK